MRSIKAAHNLAKAVSLAVVPLLFFSIQTQAQSGDQFPSKPLTLVVPFDAGGPSDLAARLVANALETKFKWSVRVENRPGAGSAIGLQWTANAPADGHTIALVTSSLITNPIIGHAKVTYEMFDPLNLTHLSPGAIAVNGNSPWNNLKDLEEAAKAAPGRVRVANNGTGSTWHLLSLLVKSELGIEFADVPYDSGSDQLMALLGNHVEAAVQSASGWLGNERSKRVKILGVSAEERLEQASHIPTLKEQGVDIVYGLFIGFVAPKGLPEDVRTTLSSALSEVVLDADYQAFAEKQGVIVLNEGPEKFAEFLAAEHESMSAIAERFFKK